MQMANFSGGLATLLSPNLINLNESVKCTNVDLSKGALVPLKGLLPTIHTSSVDNNSIFYFKGTYLTKPTGTTFVEFNDNLYIADGVGTVTKTKDAINFIELGLTPPSVKPTVSTTSFTSLFSFTFTAGTKFSADTYEYLIQYSTTSGSIDFEEIPFIAVASDKITLNISSFSDLSNVLLYRKFNGRYRFVGSSSGGLTIDDTVVDLSITNSTTPYQETLGTRNYLYTYYSSTTFVESAPSPYSDDLKVELNNVVINGLVDSLDPSVDKIRLYRLGGTLTTPYMVAEIPSNQTSYTDTLTDLQVLANSTPLETMGLIKPKTGLKFLTNYNSSLFGSIDSTLFFSDPGLVDNWRETNYIVFPEHITGLGSTQNGLLVFSRNKTWILTGDSIDNYSKFLLNGNQGCVSHSTVAYVDNYLLWLSLDGICMSTGGNIEIISLPKLGKLSLNPVTAEVYENQYFLFHTSGTLVVDFRLGVRFYELDLLARGAYYNSTFDTLQVLKPGDIGIYEHNKGSYLSLTYRTGWIIDRAITETKLVKDVYIYCNGNSSVELFIDGVSVSTTALVTGINQLKFPQAESRCYYVEFEFTGSGNIIELEFKLEGRKNGR